MSGISRKGHFGQNLSPNRYQGNCSPPVYTVPWRLGEKSQVRPRGPGLPLAGRGGLPERVRSTLHVPVPRRTALGSGPVYLREAESRGAVYAVPWRS